MGHAQTVQAITNILLKHANGEYSGSAWGEVQSFKLNRLVHQQLPIEMVLPAYPAKSPNPLKTLGPQVDLAEVLSLQRLNRACTQINSFYRPGAKIIICSDGRVFGDLVMVDDESISLYALGVQKIIADYGLSHLSTCDLEDYFDGSNLSELRMKLVKDFGKKIDQIRSEIKDDPAEKMLFNGIHRFIKEDRLVLDEGKSKNKINKECKQITYQMIQRSNAWGAVVAKIFPHSFRLSIHPQLPGSEKFGINLLPSQSRWATPWHNVAFYDGKEFCLVKRAEAEERGGKLHYEQERYGYFSNVGAWNGN